MTDAAKTLGRAVEDSEARFFVGRQNDLARLRQAFADARDRPVAVYVYGPPGVGKSALLRVFARELQQRQVPVVAIDGARGDQIRLQLRDEFASQLHIPPDSGESLDALVEALNARARGGGAVLLVDGYEQLTESDGWLRHDLFWHLGAGVCLVLAGRLRPSQLWSEDLGWTKTVVNLRLGDLTSAAVAQFLAACDIHDEDAAREVYEMTRGRPRLLCTVANALLMQPLAARGGPGAQGRWDMDRLALFLVEHILHPGSRRRTWRAGLGASQVDNVVAAAAVLPSFDRAELAALVGREALAAAWPSLLLMAVPDEASERYALAEGLRQRVAAAVVRQRPWAEREWRHTAIRATLAHARDGVAAGDGALQWLKVARMARETSWWGWMNPAAEADGHWCVRRDVKRDELADLAALSSVPLAAETLANLWRAHPGAFIVAREPSGAPIGLMLSAQVSQGTLTGLKDLPTFRQPAAASFLGSAGTREGWLVWAHIASARPGVEGALIREAVCDFTGRWRVLVPDPSQWFGTVGVDATARLGDLGFVRTESCGPDFWTLDLAGIGYGEWLTNLVRSPANVRIPESDRSDAVKEALTVLNEPEQLVTTAAARYYAAMSGDARPSSLRAWILDALATAELDDSPPSERVLLTLYYVDRLGPHEVVAERMNLHRTTYFRCHRRALLHLGEGLFAARPRAGRKILA